MLHILRNSRTTNQAFARVMSLQTHFPRHRTAATRWVNQYKTSHRGFNFRSLWK